MKNAIRGSALIGLLFVSLPNYAQVQCPDGDSCLSSERVVSHYLEEVVVTGTKTEKSLLHSPNAMSLITAEKMKWNITESLAEVLRDVPGLTITDAGQAGMKRIRIRGEDSYRVAVLVDGQEVTDHRGEGVPLTLDPSIVDRVEVIRGAGSVLYGPKALGGVINFITRKGGEKPFQLSSSAGWNSATNGQQLFVSGYGTVAGLDYRLSYGETENSNRKTPKGEIENTESTSATKNLYLGKRWDAHEVAVSWDEHKAFSEVFVEDEVRFAFPFDEFTMEIPQRNRSKIGVFYSWDDQGEIFDKVQVNAYHQVSDRQFETYWSQVFGMEKETYSESELVTDGALVQGDFTIGKNHLLVAGIQYTDDEINQGRQEILHLISPFPMVIPSEIDDRASLKTEALFFQDEWRFSESLTITAGLRQYWIDSDLINSTRDGLITPPKDDRELISAFAAIWEFDSGSIVRASYTEGYMYPSLLQLAVGGVARTFVNPNTSLEPEKSKTIELGWRYSSDRFQADVTAFISDAENYIDHVPCVASVSCIGGSRRTLAEVYVNIAEATTTGIEAYLEYQLTDSLLAYSSLTLIERENKYEEFSTFSSGVPSLSASAGLRYDGGLSNVGGYWLDFYARGETSAQETEADLREHHNAGWVTANVKGGIEFGENKNYRLIVELNNLFDNSYSTSSENLWAMERNIQSKLVMDF